MGGQHKLALVQSLAQVLAARPARRVIFDGTHAPHTSGTCTGRSIAQAAQLKLAGNHVGQALQRAQFVRPDLPVCPAAQDGKRAQNSMVEGAHRNAG